MADDTNIFKTYEEACGHVAVKRGLGKTLVTGHMSKYWREAAELYAESMIIKTKREYETPNELASRLGFPPI